MSNVSKSSGGVASDCSFCPPSAAKTAPVVGLAAPVGAGQAGDTLFVYPNFPDAGYRVRVARVEHRCSRWFEFCDGDGFIRVGEKYGVGESDPDVAGGFGRRIYCCACMALAAVAL